MPCDPDSLKGIEIFELLHDEERIELAKVVDSVRLEVGELLFQAGEPRESLFIVRSGSIELYIKDTAGQKIVDSHLFPWPDILKLENHSL